MAEPAAAVIQIFESKLPRFEESKFAINTIIDRINYFNAMIQILEV
jgi:hypothetical protein